MEALLSLESAIHPFESIKDRRESGGALRDAAKEYIGDKGHDPIYGARPLKRVIQHLLLDPLSLDVLDGKFIDGDVMV